MIEVVLLHRYLHAPRRYRRDPPHFPCASPS
jgi:hypothetical protein